MVAKEQKKKSSKGKSKAKPEIDAEVEVHLNQKHTAETVRSKVLNEANELIHGQRQDDYGPPEENFRRIARLWEPVFDIDIDPHQVALAMALVKTARVIQSPDHKDSWVDMAGYVGLGCELASQGKAP